MLKLTKRTEYGLIALIQLVDRGGEVVSVRELCEHNPMPRRFAAEVLKGLQRQGLVHSHRGANGGYSLARPAEFITLGEIVGATEGKPSLTECDLVGSYAGANDTGSCCPINNPIERLRTGIWDILQATTLRDLVRGRFHVSANLIAS